MTTTTLVLAGRTMRAWLRTPQLVVVATVQGAMFLLIFRYVFGGAIDAGPVPYVDFLVPGFVVTGLLFAGAGAAAGVAEDIDRGVVDRLRSLPVPRLGILAGRSLADTALATWGVVITTAIGFAVGFRIHGGIAAALAAVGLCVAFAAAFSWVFIAIGLVAGNAQAAQGMSLLVFPLTFVSSAYVPVDTMPGWMQPVAANQPLTMMTGAVRSLALGDTATAVLGHTTGWFVVRALLWSGAIAAVFAALAVARFRRQ
jgi:ABC transporter DrrB family efflux protein